MKTIYTGNYDLQSEPAVPIIEELILNHVGGSWSARTSAIVDSGADQSIIPIKLIEPALYLAPTKSEFISGVIKTEFKEVTSVELECQINGFKLITYFIAYGEEAIIGRDILNQFKTVLDGPPLDVDGISRVTMYSQ